MVPSVEVLVGGGREGKHFLCDMYNCKWTVKNSARERSSAICTGRATEVRGVDEVLTPPQRHRENRKLGVQTSMGSNF
jgi:hypothetical protein